MSLTLQNTSPSKAFKASKPSKALIITYYWPPSGGAGVQRWLKFSKYLPEFGWEPIIITVDPEHAAYPVTDVSLNEDVPANIKVYKTAATNYFSIYKKDKTKIPSAGFAISVDNTLKGRLLRFVRGNFFIPDPRKGWNKFAFNKACNLIETEGIKHVITTSPPHSTQLIGLKLKKKYPAIKWIADLRDPWTDIYYYDQFYPTIISRLIDSGFEKSVLKNADNIITVGSSLKNLFSQKANGIGEKIEVISNGFDEVDFINNESTTPPNLTLTYVGTLSDIYPVNGLAEALKKMKVKGIDFDLRFVGSVSQNAKEMILNSIDNSSVEFLPHVIHSEAIMYMMSSSVLLLIIPSHSSNKSIITGKIFEYLASWKPVLCIGPEDGDAAAIIKKCNAGITAGYNESDRMYNFLSNLNTFPHKSDGNAVIEFSRHSLAKRIAGILDSEEEVKTVKGKR
jgi:glycosyltransferase involved in cell wall biosynthesis